MSDPRRLTESEIEELVFTAANPANQIFYRQEVGNLLFTLLEIEEERNMQATWGEHLDNTLFCVASYLKIEGRIPDWLPAIKKAIDEIRKDRQEFAHQLVRECLYYTHADHPNEDGWYTCSYCHATQVNRERFPHDASCMVERAKKYE